MSNPIHWLELERLYHAALERTPAERAAFVEQSCSHDEALRRELESLLKHDQPDDSFFSRPAIEVAARALDEPEANLIEPGSQVGAYKILDRIARGGMGVVYRAEQQQPVRRTVALKIIKPGMDSENVVTRFQAERQALALMDHPNIARVLDAGTTSTGRLYFVMELVDGVPVTEYCRNHELDLRERLALFIPVCQAIQHAHQKGIIHRDIKPSNVLVPVYDGKPVPKVIDFGIAKATQEPLTERSMHTQAGAVIGTLEYMSPEQAESSGEDIDTRTDVYSLGAVLYEAIAGSTPLNRASLEGSSDLDIVRRIREEDPPPPSVRLGNARVARDVRGDLDWVIMKALQKDRALRYETVNGLARDLQRYLAGEPVEAAPPSVAYRIRKFARRHRVGLLTVAAFAALLVAGVVVSTRMAIRASRAEQAASAVNNFLQDDLLAQASANNQAGPGSKPDRDLKVRTALDRAAARIAGKFDRQPDVEAAIRDTIGQTYMDLGLHPDAQKQLERALDLERRVLGPENPKTLKTINRLGRLAYLQGKYPQAGMLYSEALKIERRVIGTEHLDTLSTMSSLASAYLAQGKYVEAEPLYVETLKVDRRVLGREAPETLACTHNLAVLYSVQGKYREVETLLKPALEIQRRVVGPEHPHTLLMMNSLANDYFQEAKYAEAEALQSQTLEIQRRVLGPGHPFTLLSMNNLANVYSRTDRFAEAEALYRQALEIQRRVLGPEHPDTLLSMNNLAIVEERQGKYAEAEALYNRTLEIRRRVLGPEHPDTLISMNNLAYIEDKQSKYAQAETLYNQTLEVRRRVLGPEHPDTLASMNSLSTDCIAEGNYEAAEPLMLQRLEIQRRVLGPENRETLRSMNNLGDVYSWQGKYAQAQALIEPILKIRRRVLGPEDAHTLYNLSSLANLYQRERQYRLAEGYALQALDGRRHTLGPEHPDTMDSAAALAVAYLSQGKFAESEPLARKVVESDRRNRPDTWQRFFAESLLGASLAGEKKYIEAQPLQLTGYRGMAVRKGRMGAPNLYYLDRAREWITQLYRAWGKPEKAAQWREKLALDR